MLLTEAKIGLVGAMGVGKTTLKNLVSERLGIQGFSFGAPVKADILNYKLTVDGKIDKHRDRRLIQDYAQFRRGHLDEAKFDHVHFYTEFDVSFDCPWAHFTNGARVALPGINRPNHWINEIHPSLYQHFHKVAASAIFDDVRFLNEAEYLRERGFTLIRITVPEKVRLARLIDRDGGVDHTALDDISETEMQKIECDDTIDSEQMEYAYLELMRRYTIPPKISQKSE